jgi:hypothetical protein
MAECWGWVDFSEALAWAKGLEFPDEREEAFRGLMRSVPDEDGARLERLLPLIESDDLRGHVEARLADWYLSQDLERSLEWLRSRADKVSPLADTKILMQAAQLEPGLALGYARDLAGSELQDKAYSTIAKQHVHVDPEACQAWVLDVAAESLRHELVQSVAKGWARDDLEAASAWALSLTDMADRDLALSEIAKEWIKEGYSERARQMALELHDADLRAEWSLRFFDFPDG